MTGAEILAAVRDDIDEETAAFWSDALLDRYINRAYKWARYKVTTFDAGFFEREATITYPANTRHALLSSMDSAGEFDDDPDRILMVEDISTSASKPLILDRIQKYDEDLYRDKGEVFIDSRFKSVPGYYITSESTSGIGGAQPATEMALGIRPIPSGSRTIRVTYVAAPETISAATVPDIPLPFHEVILLRAVVLAKKREEAPVKDYEVELQRVLQDAINAVDGIGRRRTRVMEPELYSYSF